RLLAHLGSTLIPIVEPADIARHVVELTARGLGASCALWLATDDEPPQLDGICYGADTPPLRTAAQRAASRGATLFDGETLGAPILREERLLGAIALSRVGAADAFMLEQIAAQTALALENARLLAETRAASVTKDVVLAVASHEIATPVAALTGYAEMIHQLSLQDELNRPALDRAIRGITRTAERVQDLSRRLLDSERIQSGHLSMERRRADLLPTLRLVVERASIGSARSISLDARATELPGRWDLTRMAEAFENLLSNALRYSLPETSVRVTVDVRAGEGHVAVEDAGIGIPEGDRASLFEAFRRGSNARFGGPGLGLGLHLVHEIVRAHDGRVHFESELGHGTTFFVTLPLEH